MELSSSFLCYLLMLLTVIQECFGCSQRHFPRTLQERIVSSDVIIWGEIVSKSVDHERSVGTSVAYSAAVRVRCVLKGRVSSRIIVDDVGKVPGKCKAIDFIENEQYIMLLRVDRHGRYIPSFDQEMYSQGVFDRIYGYCGINISQPQGEAEKESSYVDCPSILSRRVVNRKMNRCTPLDRVQKWEVTGPQPPTKPKVTITPVISARTRELETPTRRPGRRKNKNRKNEDGEVKRSDRDRTSASSDSGKLSGRRRYANPTQSANVVAIIYERSDPRRQAASKMSTQTSALLFSISTFIMWFFIHP